MPTRRLSDDKRKAIVLLHSHPANYTNQQIAETVGCSEGSVSNVRRHLPPDPLEKDKPVEVDRIEELAAHHKQRFHELQERFRKYIGDTASFSHPKSKSSKNKKALCLNDLHVPFHHESALAAALRDNADADELWIPGDFLDLFNFSRYDKYTRPFSVWEEIATGRAVMRELASRFPVVKVMHGNHDERFVKWMVRDKHIPADVIEMLSMLHPDFKSPLAKLCADFKNVKMMPPKKVDYATYSFLHQENDCILSHAERYSKVRNKAVSDVIDVLMKKLKPMGLVEDFKVVGQAHTHSAGKTWNDYGVVGIEMGCMSKVPDYDGDPKLRGNQPIVGYTTFFQNDGVTDQNASNFYRLA